jgi:hypothetical protein
MDDQVCVLALNKKASRTFDLPSFTPGGIQCSYTRHVTLARQIDLSAILFERARQTVTAQ